MKLLAYLLLFSSAVFAENEIGWVSGGSWVADSVIANGVKSETVIADDQAIDPNGSAVINVDSDSPATNSRSFVLMPGKYVGQRVRVTCRPANGNSQIDDDAVIPGGGTIKLVNNWLCNQDGNSINLFWNGLDWEEDGRVNL